MLREYVPLLWRFGLVVASAAMMLGMSHRMSPRRPTRNKDMPHQSGVPPLGDTRHRFSVEFYLFAMLFLVFDIEVVFLNPWSVVFQRLGSLGLVEMALFVLTIGVGYIYAWKRGALDWD